MTLAEDISYTFHVNAWVAGYLPESRDVGPLTGDQTEDFDLLADLEACVAPGYEPLGYVEDFEAGDGGYTHCGTNDEWEWGTPGIWPFGCASGSNCWGTDLNGTYENNANFELDSVVIGAQCRPVHFCSPGGGKPGVSRAQTGTTSTPRSASIRWTLGSHVGAHRGDRAV